jgi:hypothetical protein
LEQAVIVTVTASHSKLKLWLNLRIRYSSNIQATLRPEKKSIIWWTFSPRDSFEMGRRAISAMVRGLQLA